MPSWWNPRKLGRVVRFGIADLGDGTWAMKTTSSSTAVVSSVPTPIYATRSDTFSATASGTTVNLVTTAKGPCKWFAIQTTAKGVVTSWTVLLEVSEDGVNWTTAATHTNAIGSGILLPSATAYPSLFMRARCSAIVLGLGTNVISTILAME